MLDSRQLQERDIFPTWHSIELSKFNTCTLSLETFLFLHTNQLPALDITCCSSLKFFLTAFIRGWELYEMLTRHMTVHPPVIR